MARQAAKCLGGSGNAQSSRNVIELLICKCICVDMEGTLLTVEETVELAPVSTPRPRRRAPRPRAAAKPAAENTGDGVAEQEAVATLEVTQDRSPAQEEVAPESRSEAIALGEPEPRFPWTRPLCRTFR